MPAEESVRRRVYTTGQHGRGSHKSLYVKTGKFLLNYLLSFSSFLHKLLWYSLVALFPHISLVFPLAQHAAEVLMAMGDAGTLVSSCPATHQQLALQHER